MNRNARLEKFKNIDIYPVTCEKLSGNRTNLEVLNAVIDGGAKIIQLREKDHNKRNIYIQAVEFRKITMRADVLLIINDHLDIALSVGADGVHLGQEDLPLTAARALAPDLIIGASTHSLSEAIQAQKDGADYINIGPIFPTKTKEGVAHYLGPEAIADIGSKIDMPFTVMGGINEKNIAEVLAQGAQRVAMVTAITNAPDISQRTRMLRDQIRKARMIIPGH